MDLQLDPTTIFVALIGATSAAVVLLLWTYWLNRHERSLLFTALAFGLTAVGLVAMTVRETLPSWIYVQIGVSIILLGTSMVWGIARAFNGRSLPWWWIFAAPFSWLAACAIPGFIEDLSARIVFSSAIIGVSYLAAAIEFHRVRDGLRTRRFMTIVLSIQSIFVLVRIPAVVLEVTPETRYFADSGWFAFSMLESSIFVQVMSFLMISLTKERVESRLSDAALTDSLTGLGNRRAFFGWAESALARTRRNGARMSIVFFDLDRFKEINDSFGHPVGDAVIQAFAASADGRIRAGDFAARLGGEEFAIVLPDTSGDEASIVATEIIAAFADAVDAMGIPDLSGTACAGIAESGVGTETLADIMTAADRALYEAKNIGRSQVRMERRAAAAPRSIEAA